MVSKIKEFLMAAVEQVSLKVGDNAIHCAGCESRIELILKKQPGVLSVKADHKTQKVQVELNPEQTSEQLIRDKLAAIGYETV
jgi:Cu+-exporting ATPase